MKVWNALANTIFKRKDKSSTDHLEQNRIRSTLEDLCSKYLDGGHYIMEFEVRSDAMPYVIDILQDPVFLEKYEFQQVDETRFQIHAKEFDLLG